MVDIKISLPCKTDFVEGHQGIRLEQIHQYVVTEFDAGLHNGMCPGCWRMLRQDIIRTMLFDEMF